MKSFVLKFAVCTALLTFSGSVSAQGFLKVFSKKTEKTDSVKSSEKSDSKAEKEKGKKAKKSDDTAASDTAKVKDKIKKSDIPTYTAQKVYVLDKNNKRIKNEDGTDKYYVELVRSSDGKRVSPEVAQEQSKQINKAILGIAAKAGTSTAIGMLSGGAKGAIVGLAAGLGLSVNDIILIVKLKKDINKQKKALEVYKQSFDEEGYPTTAEVDSKTIKTLGISEENAVEKTSAQVMKELSDPAYSKPASNESIDALLAAATKA